MCKSMLLREPGSDVTVEMACCCSAFNAHQLAFYKLSHDEEIKSTSLESKRKQESVRPR